MPVPVADLYVRRKLNTEMANRAYFINHAEGEPVSLDDQRGQWLVAANYQIPVLWLAMFSKEDIKTVPTRMHDASGNEVVEHVPSFMAPVAQAVLLYEARRPTLAAVIPERYRPYVDEWEAFISTSLCLPFVQLELTEIRIMEELQHFDLRVVDYLTAFSAASDPRWDDLRAQAALDDPQVARYGLRGYPWHSEVPWK